MIRKHWSTFLPFWLVTASAFSILVLIEFRLVTLPIHRFTQTTILLFLLVSIKPLFLLFKSQINFYGSLLLGVFMPFLIIFIIVLLRMLLRSAFAS